MVDVNILPLQVGVGRDLVPGVGAAILDKSTSGCRIIIY